MKHCLVLDQETMGYWFDILKVSALIIGVRAGGARGAAAPPNFGQLRFFGQ